MKTSWPLADLAGGRPPGAGAPPAFTPWLRLRPVPPTKTAPAPATASFAEDPPGAEHAPWAPGLRLALSPLATVTSLTLESMGARRGSPPAWFRPVRDTLTPRDVGVLAAIVDPHAAGALPAALLPPPRSFRPAIEDEFAALAAVGGDELAADLRAEGLLDGPWSMVARAPSRWLLGYRSALERAWEAVRPLWTEAADLLDAEARRVGVACLQVAFEPTSGDHRPWPELERAGLAPGPRGLAVERGLVATPLLGGDRAAFLRRRDGVVSYLGYPLPGARRLAAGAGHAPRDALRQLLGGPRADLVQRVTKPTTAGALAEAMQLAPSAITHHVSMLEQCGLVTRERHGRHVLIRLSPRGVALLDLYRAPAAAAG